MLFNVHSQLSARPVKGVAFKGKGVANAFSKRKPLTTVIAKEETNSTHYEASSSTRLETSFIAVTCVTFLVIPSQKKKK